MSTRAKVGILLPDGKVRSIKILQDGYPEYTGQMLANRYDTEEKILQLMTKGDLLGLGKTIAECTPDPHGESAKDSSPARFINDNDGLDYLYIFSKSMGYWQYLPCNE